MFKDKCMLNLCNDKPEVYLNHAFQVLIWMCDVFSRNLYVHMYILRNNQV